MKIMIIEAFSYLNAWYVAAEDTEQTSILYIGSTLLKLVDICLP